MLKAVKRSFSIKFGQRIFVCLRNEQLPPQLRERIRPRVIGALACWMDKIETRKTA